MPKIPRRAVLIALGSASGLWAAAGPLALAGCQRGRPRNDPTPTPPSEEKPPLIIPTIRRIVGYLDTDYICSVAFSPDGTRLATGAADDQHLRIWDAPSGRQLLAIPGFEGPIGSMAFSPDGTRIASAASTHYERISTGAGYTGAFRRSALQLWDADTGKAVRTLKEDGYSPIFLAFSPDGAVLLAIEGRYVVRMWDVTDGREVLTSDGRDIQGRRSRIESIASGCTIRCLASINQETTVRGRRVIPGRSVLNTWDLVSGRIRILWDNPGNMCGAALSADGARVAATRHAVDADQYVLKVWDFVSGETIGEARFQGTDYPNFLRFTPAGRLIVAGLKGGYVSVWDGEVRRLLATIPGPRGHIRDVAFIPGGLRVVSGGRESVGDLVQTEPGSWSRKGELLLVWDAELPSAPAAP